MTAYALAQWLCAALVALCAAGFAGMILHDRYEERRRKRRLYHVTVPAPRRQDAPVVAGYKAESIARSA